MAVIVMGKGDAERRPIMPRPGRSSVTAEQAHERKLQRRAIKHGKNAAKRKRKGKS